MNMHELVILVNEEDEIMGTASKLEVHQKGLLHRAFSVFLFNDRGEMLLQKRAEDKYHSAGLWSNTCCSHPYVNEDISEAAKRRLKEEMGLEAPLEKVYTFLYHEPLENGLIEHELDHVFVGYTNNQPMINIHEVSAWKWVSIDALKDDMKLNPSNYTIWFRIALVDVISHIQSHTNN